MSAYITRWCEKHGEWEQDVADPGAECPECVKEGIAPSQLVAKRIAALEAALQDIMLGAAMMLDSPPMAAVHSYAAEVHRVAHAVLTPAARSAS